MGIDAFNFQNVGKPEVNLVISAIIDPNNDITEVNEGNNDGSYIAGTNVPQVKLSRFTQSKPYRLLYRYAKYEGTSFTGLASENDPYLIGSQLWLFSYPQTSHILSVYPIPHDHYLNTITRLDVTILKPRPYIPLPPTEYNLRIDLKKFSFFCGKKWLRQMCYSCSE